MKGVRFRDDVGFEGRCDYCRSWWPLTVESWMPKNGMRRCKACTAEYKRQHEAGRRASEIVRTLTNTRNRERYHLNKRESNEKARQWRALNREHIAAYNKAYRAANPERARLASRAYYAEAREAILIKKRDAYRKRAA